MAFASLRLRELMVVVSCDARTAGDAMRLAHDGGVEAGFLSPQKSGMRFNPAFMNPGTNFVVAYAGEEPVAGLVLIEDGPFGLPSDRAFIEEIDRYRCQGDAMFELGAWVIASQWRRYFAIVSSLLFGAVTRMHIASEEPRRMVLVVEPQRAKLTSEIFACELLTEPRPYLSLPGTLLVTRHASEWANHYLNTDEGLVPRRIMAQRVFDPDPDWLQIGREGPKWSDELLVELLAESAVEERLLAQMELLRKGKLANRVSGTRVLA